MHKHGGIHIWDLTTPQVHQATYVRITLGNFCGRLHSNGALSGSISHQSYMHQRSCLRSSQSSSFTAASSLLTAKELLTSVSVFSLSYSASSTLPRRSSRSGSVHRGSEYGIKQFPEHASTSHGSLMPVASAIL